MAFVHALTAIHGLGALAVWLMAAYVAMGDGNADKLATTPGARQLVDWTGPWMAMFLVALGGLLAALAWGSHNGKSWSWPAALVAYAIGVVGSLAEIVAGYPNYWFSLVVNSAVVGMLLHPQVRQRFRRAGSGRVR